jgi:hypothetical protein
VIGRPPAVPTILVAAGFWALRPSWFDGLTSFAGLLPLTVMTALLGTILLGQRRRGAILAGAALWLVTLTTYEVAILLVPALLLLLLARGAVRGAGVLALLAVVNVMLTLALRRGVTASPAYTLNLNAPEWPVTTVEQMVAAIPLASWWLPRSGPIDVPIRTAAIWIAVFLCLMLIGRPAPASPSTSLSPGGLGPLALVGLSAWILPSVLIGATVRWQQEISLGIGYLSVVWGYVGLAILAAVLIEWGVAAAPSERARRVLVLTCVVGSATLAALTFTSNLLVASQNWGLLQSS